MTKPAEIRFDLLMCKRKKYHIFFYHTVISLLESIPPIILIIKMY